jgi:TonB family protein
MQQERTGSAVTSELKVQPAQAEAAPVAVASAPRAATPKESFADSAPNAAAVRYGVSPALMGSRLLYAPKLEYPVLAKLAHVQGKVVVEAVVGRDGWVTAAKVLSGHRLLRGAALNVVRGLHYRPYTVNDRPLEVATIVTVNFRLHR